MADDKDSDILEDPVLHNLGYKVVCKIGKGTYSVVLRASLLEQPNIKIAIKVIDKVTVDQEYLRRFLPRELKVVARLRHPNLISTYKAAETGRRVYMVMEFASHGNLLQWIRHYKVIDETRACRWFHHLLEGVAYLHQQGVGHRDLKCENLLIGAKHVLKVADFSYCRGDIPMDVEAAEVNQMAVLCRTFCGSPSYFPPELARGEPYQVHLSDTWSMGVILYAMIFGHLPFQQDDFVRLLKQLEEPVRFTPDRLGSEPLRHLLDRIFQRAEIRAYFPEIRDSTWYRLNYKSEWMPFEKQSESSTEDRSEHPKKEVNRALESREAKASQTLETGAT